jgi:hypothetical protein
LPATRRYSKQTSCRKHVAAALGLPWPVTIDTAGNLANQPPASRQIAPE